MASTAPLISIVDDDLSVRRALGRLVQSAGYTVATFASAREFLDSPALSRAACSGVVGSCASLDEHTLLHASDVPWTKVQ
jgi:DNA-binding NtrC family response regulator